MGLLCTWSLLSTCAYCLENLAIIGFVFANTNAAVAYFCQRLLCRFDLAVRANSTRRRIASEREGLSGCCFAQSSIADLSGNESRIADTGSCPVAGRPRFFRTTGIDFVGIIVLRKRQAGEKR